VLSFFKQLLRSGIETHEDFIVHGPHQSLVHVFTWNGEGFVLDDLEIGTPEYRFQAVHNGDLYTLLHEYEQAAASYRQTIDDPTLLDWMDNSIEYFRAV
jgi:hypothetical protein